MTKTIEVVAAVVGDGGRYLATERGYGPWEGWWEFPGGKVEAGETREQALMREIREELAMDIAIDRFLLTVDYDYPDFHLTMHCYLCHIAAGSPTLLEHHAARWLDGKHLGTVHWLPADRQVVEALKLAES